MMKRFDRQRNFVRTFCSLKVLELFVCLVVENLGLIPSCWSNCNVSVIVNGIGMENTIFGLFIDPTLKLTFNLSICNLIALITYDSIGIDFIKCDQTNLLFNLTNGIILVMLSILTNRIDVPVNPATIVVSRKIIPAIRSINVSDTIIACHTCSTPVLPMIGCGVALQLTTVGIDRELIPSTANHSGNNGMRPLPSPTHINNNTRINSSGDGYGNYGYGPSGVSSPQAQ